MKQIFLIILSAMLLGCACAEADELKSRDLSEAAGWFTTNPRNVKDIGDPFILAENGTCYMFATGGPIGFNVWRSTDLTGFEKTKALKKVDWASGDYWAPEVFEVNGRYVMLFTARMRENGSLRTGIAFSGTPEGPYEDPLGHPLMDYGYATIDATLTWDDEGNPYLIYVRDCSENTVNGRHESHIYGVRLADDLMSTVGEPVLLIIPVGEWEARSGDTRWNEGPAVVKHEGRYFLFYSVNGYWMKEYSVSAAVSDEPLGPYVKQANNPLLYYTEENGNVTVSGPGHNAFFTIGEELFTAYHTHTYPQAPSGNRQLCIDRAGFHADGTAYINGPTLAPQLRPLAELGKVNLTAEAVCAEDPESLLTDGDYCIRTGSAAWVWHGQELTYIWPENVTAELLIIYPAEGQTISGKIQADDGREAAFASETGEKPGAAAMLLMEPTEINSLKIAFDKESGIGEILLIGTK